MHSFPIDKKEMVEPWKINLRRFVEKSTNMHHWVEKALLITDAAAIQVRYDHHSSGRDYEAVVIAGADQAVLAQWAGTGDQVTVLMDNESWNIGCPGSLKYRTVMAQLDALSAEFSIPRIRCVCEMLTDEHCKKVFKQFI